MTAIVAATGADDETKKMKKNDDDDDDGVEKKMPTTTTCGGSDGNRLRRCRRQASGIGSGTSASRCRTTTATVPTSLRQRRRAVPRRPVLLLRTPPPARRYYDCVAAMLLLLVLVLASFLDGDKDGAAPAVVVGVHGFAGVRAFVPVAAGARRRPRRSGADANGAGSAYGGVRRETTTALRDVSSGVEQDGGDSSTGSSTRTRRQREVVEPPPSPSSTSSSLSDVDARVLREMLQDPELNLAASEEDVRKLLERGTEAKKKKASSSVERPPSSSRDDEDDDDEPSEFSSTVIKKLTSTKLWRKLSVQAEDLLESVGIAVRNKIENDLKVVAALGLFAWDRVVRDVARALPESGTGTGGTSAYKKRRVYALTNTSSYVDSPAAAADDGNSDSSNNNNQLASDMEDVAEQLLRSSDGRRRGGSSAYEAMNRPADEIRSVTRDIWDILTGERTASSVAAAGTSSGSAYGGNRGLRTAAPAGIANLKERNRRAYLQRTRVVRQSQDVTRIPSKVVDTAYELRRELASEASKPGYKTEGIRNAIAEGVSSTKNLLQSVKDGARLAAARKKELRLKQALQQQGKEQQQQPLQPPTRTEAASDSDISTASIPNESSATGSVLPPEELIRDFKAEASRVATNLRTCIRSPETTWLQADVLSKAGRGVIFDESALREVVTSMILVRDEIETRAASAESDSVDELVEELRAVRASVEGLRSRVAESVSYVVADELFDAVMVGTGERGNEGSDDEDPLQPLILRLEDIVSSDYSADKDLLEEEDVLNDEETASTTRPFFMDVDNDDDGGSDYASSSTVITPDVIDVVVPEYVLQSRDEPVSSSSSDGIFAELVSDDDFDVAVGEPRLAKGVAGDFDGDDGDLAHRDDDGDNISNALALASLRTLDVAFFVVEKTFTVAIPNTLVVGETVTRRTLQANQGGKGHQGWQRVRNSADPKGRY